MQSLPRVSSMEICVRIVDGRMRALHDTAAVNPFKRAYLRDGLYLKLSQANTT